MRNPLLSVFSLAVGAVCQSASQTGPPQPFKWTRTFYSGKGLEVETAAVHPLGYFMDFTASAPQRSFTKVGTLAGFPIWQLTKKGSTELTKSILVQTASGEYVEIYRLEASGPVHTLAQARILKAGDASVLQTQDPDGGNGGGCWEGYWWFDASGAHAIDFSTLHPAMAKQVPPGAQFSTMCTSVHLEAQEVESWVQAAGAECHPCKWIGRVTAKFRLDGARVVPLQVEFTRDTP